MTRIAHQPEARARGLATAGRPGRRHSIGFGMQLWQRFGAAARARIAPESGHALLTTMIAAACLLPLGAFAAMQARLDALVQQHTRIGLETFTVAESGLEHALADLGSAPRFDRLLAGPDGQPGSGDDGEFPFSQPPPEFFPRPPFRYQVRVAARGPNAVQITARGFGPLASTRGVVATVVRSVLPYVPAAVALAAPTPALELGGEFSVTGLVPQSDGRGLPALAAAGPEEAAALAARLSPDAAARLVGSGGSPSIAAASIPSCDALAALAAQRAEARVLSGDASGALGDGLFVSPGSLRLADASGSGVLVVGGALELNGAATFSGLVVALGDVRVEPGSSVAIDGALLVGTAGALVSLRGAGHVAYDQRVIERVDAAFAGLLPRRARVTGWREEPDAAL